MTVVCITGMHRSGTSMVSRMLNLCGVYLGGENELLPATADNPEGFWENINFVNINEKILKGRKSTWDTPPSHEPGWELSGLFDKYRQDAKTLIKGMAMNSHWGWKDPRTSLTLPFWRQLIPDLKIIICVRNPLEVAQSLSHRNGFSDKFTLDLWKTYYDSLLSNPIPENQIITHYQSYFIEPVTELHRLLNFIGCSADEHTVKQACETTLPALKHNRATLESLIKNGATWDVVTLYAQLCTQVGPVYWSPDKKELQKYSASHSKAENSLEEGLLLGVLGKDLVIHTLIDQITLKEENIQSLTAQLKKRELELSALPVESKIFKELTFTRPIEAMKVFTFIWRSLLTLFPQNSRREKAATFFVRSTIKLYTRVKGLKYRNWINRFDVFSEQEGPVISRRIEAFERKPLLSVLMPVYNPPIQYLDEAIKSVRGQAYPYWELCIADDASPNYLVRSLIEKHAREDQRIRSVFRSTNGHISASSNSALEIAAGEFAVLLDHDDLLHPLALYYVAQEANRFPDVEVIYSDEDRLDYRGQRTMPYFKPDFDYDLLLSQNMVSHLGVYRTDTIRKAGGFRIGFEGSQDYDLLFRVMDKIKLHQIRHIPHVLYHWRISNQSAASGMDSKPYAYDSGLRVIKDHLARNRVDALVEQAPGIDAYRVKYSAPQPHPSVSIILLTTGLTEKLEQNIDSILSNTRYQNYNVLVCLNKITDANPQESYEDRFEGNRVSFIQNDAETNQSNLINQAVTKSKAEYICLLNEHVQGFSPGWLELLVGQAVQAGVGAVSPLLLQPNGRIFSSGLILRPDEVAVHLFNDLPKHPSYFGWATIQKGFSAIPDPCVLVLKSHFLDVGGYNEILSARFYANIDFCLRLKEKGLRNIVAPIVELYIHKYSAYNKTPWRKMNLPGSDSAKDQEYIKDRWQAWLEHDPTFNPNLDLKRGRILLANSRHLIRNWD